MKKLKSKRGVTITEMLCVILILALIGATMVTGIQFGVKSFRDSVARSEAKILCSTLSTAVKDELRFTKPNQINTENGNVVYFSKRNGGNSYLAVQDGQIVIKGAQGDKKLVANSSYTYGTTADMSISYDGGIFTVNIIVYGKDGITVLAESAFDVQCINYKEGTQ